jgi:hypothetical protein
VPPKSRAFRRHSGDVSSSPLSVEAPAACVVCGHRHQTTPSAARHSVEDIDKASHPLDLFDTVRSAMTKVRVGACG